MESHSRKNHWPDFSTLGKLLLLMAVSWALAASASGAPPDPDEGDGRGLFVRLELPWTTLLTGECLQFRYTLANAGDKPAPVAIPWEKYGFGLPAGGQPYLEAKWQGRRRSEMPEYDIQKAVWPPIGMEGKKPQAWGELHSGHKITWNECQIPVELFGVGCHEGLDAVQAHWLVGPNRWISSEAVPVKIASIPISEWQEAFKLNWSSYGLGRDSRSSTVYRIPIEGKMYLFVDGIYRVTEVEPEDELDHQIDKDGTNLRISIKKAKGSRNVYYHLRKAMTRDTPWPIGPASLFFPKPEPIPAAELESLCKAALPSAENSTAGVRLNRKAVSGAHSEGRPAGVPEDGNGARLWTVVSLVILMMFMVLALLRKRRQPRTQGK